MIWPQTLEVFVRYYLILLTILKLLFTAVTLTYCDLVMPYGDLEPSHYLNQYWPPIGGVQWHSPESIMQQMPKLLLCVMSLKIVLLKLPLADESVVAHHVYSGLFY